jgi:hypothetical protein
LKGERRRKIKLDSETKWTIGIVFVLLAISGIGAVLLYTNWNNSMIWNSNTYNIISNEYPISVATFNSPNIIIQTSSVQEFMSAAQRINATVVYQTDPYGFVVVDKSFRYGYNLPFPEFGINPIYLMLTFIPAFLAFFIGCIWECLSY